MIIQQVSVNYMMNWLLLTYIVGIFAGIFIAKFGVIRGSETERSKSTRKTADRKD